MGLRGGPHDRQARAPRHPRRRRPGCGPPPAGLKPAESPLPVRCGNAWSVVGDREPGVLARRAHRHRDLRSRVARRVVDQVAEHPVQPVGVPGDLRGPGSGQPDRDPGVGVPADLLPDQAGQVHPALRGAPGVPLVQPGQRQQVLGQPGQPERVREHVAGGLPPVLAVRVVQRHLQLGPDAGDRAAQLVRGVGDQPALAFLGRAEPAEHVVQGQGQVAHLVAGLGHREGPWPPGPGDVLGAPAQFGDRPQGGPRDQPARPGQQDQQQRGADQQRPGQRGQALAHLVVGDRGDDGPAVPGGRGGHPDRVGQPEGAAVQEHRPAVPGVGRRHRARQQRDKPVRVRGHVHDPARRVRGPAR